MRPFEQIRVDLAYMNTNVRLVGVGAGVTYGPAGATHHAIEDIAIMRALPNMAVLSPSDPYEVEWLIKSSVKYSGPIYFRLAKKGEPIISNIKKEITIGKFNTIKSYDDSKIVILFTSNAYDIAIKVEQDLSNLGHKADIISVHTIKPFDEISLKKLLESKKFIFTIEEHNIIGGLGSVVSEYIAESKYNPIFKRFGLSDNYSHYVGSQKFIREKFGLTSDFILKNILELV